MLNDCDWVKIFIVRLSVTNLMLQHDRQARVAPLGRADSRPGLPLPKLHNRTALRMLAGTFILDNGSP